MTSQAVYLGSQRVVLDVSHVWEGLMYSTNIDLFFDDVSKDTVKNALYEVETLVGDAILVSSVNYRIFNEDLNWVVTDLPMLCRMAAN
jgi:hypothetical protein